MSLAALSYRMASEGPMYPALTESVESNTMLDNSEQQQQRQQQQQPNEADNSSWYPQTSCVEQRRLFTLCWEDGASTTTRRTKSGNCLVPRANVEWNQYNLSDAPYLTPVPTSTFEDPPYLPMARASMPTLHYGNYNHMPYHSHQMTPQPDSNQYTTLQDPHRPRSSMSAHGMTSDNLAWTSAGLGISTYSTAGEVTPFPAAAYASNLLENYTESDYYSPASSHDIRQPQPRRSYTSIAPNPDFNNSTAVISGITSGAGTPISSSTKRKRTSDAAFNDDQQQQQQQQIYDAALTPASHHTPKRTKRAGSIEGMSEDERYLVSLKEEEGLPWREIVKRHYTDKGVTIAAAALQMRYKRLKERNRRWEEKDLAALRKAVQYWESEKWHIISEKMREAGPEFNWSPQACSRKWSELSAASAAAASAAAATAAANSNNNNHRNTGTPISLGAYSSPLQSTAHFSSYHTPL